MKILIASNRNNYSEQVIQFAVNLFLGLKPELVILYVKSTYGNASDDKFFNREIDNLNQLGIKATFKMRRGNDIAQEIIKESRSGNYDVVVLGSRDTASFLAEISEGMLGEIPQKVIESIQKSILIVKGPKNIAKVLISTDGTQSAEGAVHFWGILDEVNRLANRGWGMPKISIVNVIPELYSRFNDFLSPIAESQLEILETLPGKRTEYLYRAKKILDGYGIESKVKLREGNAAEEILKESERDYDLIVMGRKGRRRASLGKQAVHVIRHSKISVLLYDPIRNQLK